METKTDYSYGVVPVRKNEMGEWEVFVLNQISVRTDVYWTFPKGHPNPGETPEETALRELQEESGLSARLEPAVRFTQEYEFIFDGVRIEKEVTYYLGYVDDPTYTLQPEEVVTARWCGFAEASALLTYENNQRVLREVATFLDVTF